MPEVPQLIPDEADVDRPDEDNTTSRGDRERLSAGEKVEKLLGTHLSEHQKMLSEVRKNFDIRLVEQGVKLLVIEKNGKRVGKLL